MPEEGRYAAIVLAAGASRRLGQPKQLARYQGVTLVRRAAELALASGAAPVVVIVGAAAQACRDALAGVPVMVLENPDYLEGMGSSLRIGMAALSTLLPVPDRVLLLVCDQPLLTPGLLLPLLQADAPGGVAAAAYGGHLGVPAVFHREHFAALAQVSGDQGARSLLTRLPVTPVPLPEAAVDVDTPADLASLPQ